MDSDSQLLQRFATGGDQAAFTELVSRHAAMVRGVAWRRAGDWTLAEETAQNVFAILARKAPALRHENLAGWLHRTAVLESVNALRKAAHYRATLHQLRHAMNEAPVPPFSGGPGAALEELIPHLDEALARLPAEARHLVVLRYLERRPPAEVAAATGKNPEACRKHLQRALRRLETLLRRRGFAPGGARGLAALLTAGDFLPPPAPSAALAAAALKAAPALTLTPLATLTLPLMKTGSIPKTAALTLALAAIPLGLLLHDNAGLRTANRELQLRAERPAAPVSPGQKTGASSRLPEKSAPGAPGSARRDAKSPDTAPPADGAPERGRLEALRQKGRDKALRLAAAEYTRLTLNLPDLTDDQKTRIRAALETKSLNNIRDILQAFESGAVASGLRNPANLTASEKEALSRMARVDPRQPSLPEIDAELRDILTPDQLAAHTAAREARRVSQAEESAADTLKFISRSFDLSAGQKDRIFQQLARLALTPESAAPAATETDPFPEIGSCEEARDRIIRAHLTPEQAGVFDQKRAAEREVLRQQMMEFYAAPKPAAPAETDAAQ